MATKFVSEAGFVQDVTSAWSTVWSKIGNIGGALDSPFDVSPKSGSRRQAVELLPVAPPPGTHEAAVAEIRARIESVYAQSATKQLGEVFHAVIFGGANQAAAVDAMIEFITEPSTKYRLTGDQIEEAFGSDAARNPSDLRTSLSQSVQQWIQNNSVVATPQLPAAPAQPASAAAPQQAGEVEPAPQSAGGLMTADDEARLERERALLNPERSAAFYIAGAVSFLIQAIPALLRNTIYSIALNSWWSLRIHTARMARNYLFHDWYSTQIDVLNIKRRLAADERRVAVAEAADRERRALKAKEDAPKISDNRGYLRISTLGGLGVVIAWIPVAISLLVSAFIRETWRSFRNQNARAALSIFEYKCEMVDYPRHDGNGDTQIPVNPRGGVQHDDLDYDNPSWIERSNVDKTVVRNWKQWGFGIFGLIASGITIAVTAVVGGTAFETWRSARMVTAYLRNSCLDARGWGINDVVDQDKYPKYYRDKGRTWLRHAWGFLGYLVLAPFIALGIGVATVVQESYRSWNEAKNIYKGWFWDYQLAKTSKPTLLGALERTLERLVGVAKNAVHADRPAPRRWIVGGLGWLVSLATALPVFLVAGVVKQSIRTTIGLFWTLAELVLQDKHLYTYEDGRKGVYKDNRLVFPQRVIGVFGYIPALVMAPIAFVASLVREGRISAVNVFTKLDSLMGTRARAANDLAVLAQSRLKTEQRLQSIEAEITALGPDAHEDANENNSKWIGLVEERIVLQRYLDETLPEKMDAARAKLGAPQRQAAGAAGLRGHAPAAAARTFADLDLLMREKQLARQRIEGEMGVLGRKIDFARGQLSAPAVAAGTATTTLAQLSVVPTSEAIDADERQLETLRQQFEAIDREIPGLSDEYGVARSRVDELNLRRERLESDILRLEQPENALLPPPPAQPQAAGAMVEPVEQQPSQLTSEQKKERLGTLRTELERVYQEIQRETTSSAMAPVPDQGAANDPIAKPGWSSRAPGVEGWVREGMGCIGFALSAVVSSITLGVFWFARENARLYSAHWRKFDSLTVEDHDYVPLSAHTDQEYSKWYHYAAGAPAAAIWWATAVVTIPVVGIAYYLAWPFLQMNGYAFKTNFSNLWKKATVDHYKWAAAKEYRPSPWNGQEELFDVNNQPIGARYLHNSMLVKNYFKIGFIGAGLGLAFGAVAWLGAIIVRESYRSAKYGVGAVHSVLYDRGFSLNSIYNKNDDPVAPISRSEDTRSNSRVAIGAIGGTIATILSIPVIAIGGAFVSFWHGKNGKVADYEGKWKIGQGPVSRWGGTVLGTLVPVVGNTIGYIGLRNLLTLSYWRTVFAYGPTNYLHAISTVIAGIIAAPITAVVLGATKLVQAIFGWGLFSAKRGVAALEEKYNAEEIKQQQARFPLAPKFGDSTIPAVRPIATEPVVALASGGEFARIHEDIVLIEGIFKDAYAATNWLGKITRIEAEQQGQLGVEAYENVASADSFTPAGFISNVFAALRQIVTFGLAFNDERSLRVDLAAFRKYYREEGIKEGFNPYRFFQERRDNPQNQVVVDSKAHVVMDGKAVLIGDKAGKDPQALINDAVIARGERVHGDLSARYPVAGAHAGGDDAYRRLREQHDARRQASRPVVLEPVQDTRGSAPVYTQL